MPLKIALCGPAGSGKSSVITHLVEKYNMTTADVGQVFRARAVEQNMTISEYDTYLTKNPQEDITIDHSFKKLVEECENDLIVSWRVGFHFVPDVISLWLWVSPEEGAMRVMMAQRGKQEQKYETPLQSQIANADRMEWVRLRLLGLYGIDFTDINNHHGFIDTTSLSLEEVADEVMKYANEINKKRGI